MAALVDIGVTGWIWVAGGVRLGEGVVCHVAYCWNFSRVRFRLISGGEIQAFSPCLGASVRDFWRRIGRSDR